MTAASSRPTARATAAVRVTVQNACRSRRVPAAATVTRWVRHATQGRRSGEITVRFVSSREARALNERFRGRDYVPNVLSFPHDASTVGGGDVAICPVVCAREARAQGKTFIDHLAHLVVHAVLHLRGHDHIARRDALRMERLESRLLGELGHGDPWAIERAPRARIRAARARPAPAA